MTNPFKSAPRCVQWAAVCLASLPVFEAVVALKVAPMARLFEWWSLWLPSFALLWAIAAGLLFGIKVVRIAAVGLVIAMAVLRLSLLSSFGSLDASLVHELTWQVVPVLSIVLCFLPAANRYFGRTSARPGAVVVLAPGDGDSPAVAVSRRTRRLPATTIALLFAGLIVVVLAVNVLVLPALRSGRAVDEERERVRRGIYREADEREIGNNLRMLATAAGQHYLDTSATTAAFADLVGPNRFVSKLTPLAGERYPETISYNAELVAVMSDGVRICYDPQSGEVRREKPGLAPK